jgi:hypothetical protein
MQLLLPTSPQTTGCALHSPGKEGLTSSDQPAQGLGLGRANLLGTRSVGAEGGEQARGLSQEGLLQRFCRPWG